MNEIGDVQIETPFVDNKVRKDPLEFDKGAWGWLVVAATSFNFGILVGLPGNYALIYNELATVYKDTEHSVFYAGNKIICEFALYNYNKTQLQSAAWIGSGSNGLKYFFCLFGTFFVSYFDVKKIGLLGGNL